MKFDIKINSLQTFYRLFKAFQSLAPLRLFAPLAVFLGIFICFALVLKPEIFIILHQFLFAKIFIGLAFSAFLLTAMPVWCEFKHSLKAFKFTLFILLSLVLFSEFIGFGSILMSVFWLTLFLQSLYFVILSKNTKNFSLLFLLFFLFVLELLQGLNEVNVLELSYFLGTRLQISFLFALIIGILIISFRISIVLCNEALQKMKPQSLFIGDFITKNLSIFGLFLLIFALLFQQILGFKDEVLAFLCFALAAFFFSNLKQWLEAGLLGQNYIVIFFCFWLVLSLCFIGLGLDFMNVFGVSLKSAFIHLLNIILLLGFSLFVFCIASLRHSTLTRFGFDFRLCLIFIFVFLAAFLRTVFAPGINELLGLDFSGFESFLPAPLFIILPCFFLALSFILWLFYFISFYKKYKFKRE